MAINNQLISNYIYLLKHAGLHSGYQELLKFVSQIRLDSMIKFPDYQFVKLSGNPLEYSYFQGANQRLASRGLKIVVVFMYREGNCQICLSGRNRQVQIKYASLVGLSLDRYELAANPQKVDYIFREVISFARSDVDFAEMQFQITSSIDAFICDVEEWLHQIGE